MLNGLGTASINGESCNGAGASKLPIGAPVFALNVASVGDRPTTTTTPPVAIGGRTGRVPVSWRQRWWPLPRLTALTMLSSDVRKTRLPSAAAPEPSPPAVHRHSIDPESAS